MKNIFNARSFLMRRILLNAVVFLLAALAVIFSLSIQYGILIGFISILISIIIFPDHPEKDFRAAIIPILQAYEDYLTAIKNALLQKYTDIHKKRISVEEAMRHSPQWVYQLGFEARLREGYRHFLIRVEQFGEALFAMQSILHHPLDEKFLHHFSQEIEFITTQNCRLMQTLTTLIALQKPTVIIEDWIEDIVALEKKFYTYAPQNPAAFNLNKDNIYFAAFIQHLKDLREILLKMVQSIR